MLLRLILVVFIGVCWAQEDPEAPKPCCIPAQWTGKAVSGAANSRRGSVGVFMPNIAIDFTNNRFAVHEIVVPHGRRQEEENDMVDDFATQPDHPRVYNVTTIGRQRGNTTVVNFILWDRQKCFTRRYPAKSGRKHCIPAKAKFGGSATLGGDSGVRINRWVMSSRKYNDTNDTPNDIEDYIDAFMLSEDTMRPRPRRGFYAASIVVSNKGCIPISEHFVKGDRRSYSVMGATYFDIKGGIKDPSVFNPPSFCKQDDDYDVVDDMEITPLAQFFVEKFNQ